MNKLTTLLLVLVSLLFISSCRMDDVSNVRSGIKAIGNCCQTIGTEKAKSGCTFISEEVTKELQDKSASLMPVYTWDAKQMMW